MTACEIWEVAKDSKTADLFFLKNRIEQEIRRRFECAKKGENHGTLSPDQTLQGGEVERSKEPMGNPEGRSAMDILAAWRKD